MLRAEPVELLGIEHGIAAADAVEREACDEVAAREDLLVAAGRPAEQGEEVHEGFRQDALRLVLADRGGAMPLAQPLLVGAQNQRHVGEGGHVGAKRPVQDDLLGCVRDVIVAANDMRDGHVDVVADDGELIGGQAVGPHNHEVFDRGVVDRDGPVHLIGKRRLALRDADAHGARPLCGFHRRDLVSPEPQAVTVVDPALTAGFGRRAFGLQSLCRAIAVVGVAAADQRVGTLAMPAEARRLRVGAVRAANLRAFVPLNPHPAQAAENRPDHLVGRPLGVGVLDAKDERAAVTAGVEPVEQRRAGASDVEVPGGRGGEADTHSSYELRVTSYD